MAGTNIGNYVGRQPELAVVQIWREICGHRRWGRKWQLRDTDKRESEVRGRGVSAPNMEDEMQGYNWYFVLMIARKKKAALHHSAALFINSDDT